MNNQFYTSLRPDPPLVEWIKRQQPGTVVVHRRDLPRLQAAGLTNVTALPHGGPQPGEVWRPLEGGGA